MNKAYDVIVIGGGASGMMAAGRAAQRGRKVLLLEKNAKLGAKLSITGGGRCNITNAEDDEHILLQHYSSAEKFLYSPFAQFGVKETFSFFESLGLPLDVQANKRAFPKTENARDVVRALERFLRTGGVAIQTHCNAEGFAVEEGTVTGVRLGADIISADSYILATGGKSHPETGSTGDGFSWLSTLGHTIIEPTPTIVPLAVSDRWIKSLSGVALDNVKITFYADREKQFALKGRILCTHFGLSGPLILNSAAKVADLLHAGIVTATIDIFPTLDLGAVDKRIIDVFDHNKNKGLKNVLKFLVPPGTANALLTLVPEIDVEKKVHSISKEERKTLGRLLKALPVGVNGLMGYDRAVVADGGLALNEVDGKTLRSRIHSNLFVTGDVLHISRPSGGYSLQLCWTTGWVAGSHA